MTGSNVNVKPADMVASCVIAGCLVIAFFVAFIASILGLLKLFGVL
jgi:hypothetical protein